MEREFVPQEITLELKELGFDKPCYAYYDGAGYVMIKEIVHCVISAPTFSQAFRWFREKYNIQATIEPTKDQHRFELGFNYWIWNTKTAEEWFTEPRDRPAGDYVFDSYEEAELECLKKLIEIVKEKK